MTAARHDCGEAGHDEGRCGNAQCLRGNAAKTAEPDYDDPARRCGGPGCDGNCCQPVEEPVAWMLEPIVQRHAHRRLIRGIYAAKPTDEQWQIAELDGDRYVPLYATAQQREPLTDEQIAEIRRECVLLPSKYDSHYGWAIHFARAVEKAHGITGEPE